jgi:hypothetical protein
MVKHNKLREAAQIVKVYDSDIDMANDVAIARVMAVVEGEYVEAVGVAKRHPDDKANPRVAALIAYSRATMNLAHKIQKRADGAVKHAEDMTQLKLTKKTDVTSEKKSALKMPSMLKKKD